MLQFFLLIWFEWIMIDCQLNLYNTDRTINKTLLEYDCLYYRVRNEKLAYQELSNVIDETIPYCFRPINESEILIFDYLNIRDDNFTFEELYLDNITTQQLLSWSATDRSC